MAEEVKTEEAVPAAAEAVVAQSGAAPVADDGVKIKKKKPGVPPARGKKLRNVIKNNHQKLAKEGVSTVKKAVGLLKGMKRAKFDETIEIHIKLGVDTTQSDQMVRGTVPLPHGIGKTVRVLVFCQGDKIAQAKAAGAEFAGGADIIEKIQKENFLDFDVAIATQDMMGQVSRLGKILGPRNLMPTPKAGTVVQANADIGNAVKEFKAGKVEYRADKGGNVHAGVGKMSFDEDKLVENIAAFVDQVKAAKPVGVKGNYVQGVTVSATMSPGVAVSL